MKAVICTAAICLLLAPAVAQEYGLLFDQPHHDGGWAIGSLLDPANGFDFYGADDFSNLTAPVSRIVVFGFGAQYDGSWFPAEPAAIEPFIVRFYEYELNFAPGLFAPSTGLYKVELFDDYGDGWNGGRLDLLVNGTLVLNGITLVDGPGPATFTFPVTVGDEISTIYTAGDWAFENYYRILDELGNLVAEDGGTMDSMWESVPDGILPAGTGIPAEPAWDAPTATLDVMAESELVGIAWDNMPLYAFTIDLPASVDMEAGWISAQINSALGSGAGFFWLNSQAGNGLSWQWSSDGLRGPATSRVLRRDDSRSGPERARPIKRDASSGSYDLALQLWGGSPTAPQCAVNPAPEDGASMVSIYTEALTWIGSSVADGYKIYLGTDNPPSNVVNGVDLGDVQEFGLPQPLPESTYYWMIVPYNDLGDAQGCSVWSFTTAPDGYVYVGDPLTTDESSSIPISSPFNYSLVQSLYGRERLHVTSGVLTRISYFYDFIETVEDLPISVWVGETELSALPNTWVPASQLTEVFRDAITIDHQQNILHIDLMVPYEYLGGNLVVLVQRELTQSTWAWSNNFATTVGPDFLESTVIYVSEDTPLDPANPQTTGYLENLIPNTAFQFEGQPVPIDGGVGDQPVLPLHLTALHGAYPNPFNPMTTVSFSLATAQHVKLSVYNMAGKLVSELADDHFPAGVHPVVWNGMDNRGRGVASGTYLLNMVTAESVRSSKMMLVR